MVSKVGIVLAVYNGEKYIEEAVNSVLEQTYEDWLLFIVDDGSTDGTPDILRQLGQDARIRTTRISNQGQAAARTVGSQALPHVDYLAFLDHDDCWYPGKLNLQVELMGNYPDIAVAYSDCDVMDADNKVWGEYWRDWGSSPIVMDGDHFASLLHGNFIPGVSALVRRSAFVAIGGFNPAYQYVLDYDLWLRLSRLYPFLGVKDRLCAYRVHEGQLTQTIKERAIKEHIRLLEDVLKSEIPEETRTVATKHLENNRRKLSKLISAGDAADNRTEQNPARPIYDLPGHLLDAEVDVLSNLAASFGEGAIALEVGSYRGKSANAIGRALSGILHCIDPWESCTESLAAEDSQDSPESVYQDFIVNTDSIRNKLSVHREQFENTDLTGCAFDLVFIDGDHSYEHVQHDIRKVLPHLRDGAVLCGHDYSERWPGVQQAVDEFGKSYSAHIVEWGVYPNTSIWYARIKRFALTIAAEHFSTGGMPAIVAMECDKRPLYDIDIYVEYGDWGHKVQYSQVSRLSNVTIHCFDGDHERMAKEILDHQPPLLLSHEWSKHRKRFKAAGIRCIDMLHSSDPGLWNPEYINGPDPDEFLVVCPASEQLLREFGKEAPIKRVRTPIDTERFDPDKFDKVLLRRKHNYSDQDFVILVMGIWAPHKNQAGALVIFEQIRKQIPCAKLLMVGVLGENLKWYWEPLYEKYKNDPDVEIVGEVYDPETYYALSDVLMHPSQSEGCCNAIREAASMALPCVVNDIRANRDSFGDGPFIFASTDYDGIQFVEAIEQIYEYPIERITTGRNLRRWVCDNYGVEQYLRFMDGIYQQIHIQSPVSSGPEDSLSSCVESNPYRLEYPGNGVKLTVDALDNGDIGLRVLDGEGGYWENSIVAVPGQSSWIEYFGKPWFIPFHSQVLINGDVVYEERLNLHKKSVGIEFESKALGDTLAWLPGVLEFQRSHGCLIKLRTFWSDMLDRIGNLPDGVVIVNDIGDVFKRIKIGCYHSSCQKHNWRTRNLRQIAEDTLSVDPGPNISFRPSGEAPTPNRYVCISEHATTKAKMWNYPGGWQTLVDGLNGRGYKVAVISREPTMLQNVLNWTGDADICDRAVQLVHAEFFVGVSSGLAWLANAVGTHVFMLNTCTESWHEFQDNCTHIGRSDVCRGCWNNADIELDRSWDWCPMGLDFQCSRYLEPQYVLNIIDGVV